MRWLVREMGEDGFGSFITSCGATGTDVDILTFKEIFNWLWNSLN